jgi:uncharacterized protein YjbI with pentapeptide repeats
MTQNGAQSGKEEVLMKSGMKVCIVLAGLSTWLSALPAQAGLADLSALLRGPAGKYAVFGTENGLRMITEVMGEKVTADHLDDVIAFLGKDEMASFSEQLESRLDRIQTMLRIKAATTSESAESILQALSGEELSVVHGQNGVEFLPTHQTAEDFEQRVKAFMEIKSPGKLAGEEMAGQVFDIQSKLVGADLRFANMSGIEAPYAHFDGAKMNGANLSQAMLEGSNFKNAQMAGADLSGAKLKNSAFRNVNLRNANLRGAHLGGSDMQGADLRGADLTGAFMNAIGFRREIGVELKGAIFNSHTQLPFSAAEAKKLGMVFIK